MHKPLNNFIYNAEHNFIFAYVPKAACSNWKCVMRYLAGYENYLDTRFAHDRKINGLRHLSEEPDPWSLLNNPKIKKITFVRSPYTRCLSAYINKIEFNLPKLRPDIDISDIFLYATDQVDRFRIENLDTQKYPEVTFEVFLRWLQSASDWLRDNEHWLPQAELTLIDRIQYDFIGRFENISTDAPKILEMMQCDIEFPTQKEIKFAPTGASQKMRTYYNGAEAALVEQIFKKDFEHFSFEGQSHE